MFWSLNLATYYLSFLLAVPPPKRKAIALPSSDSTIAYSERLSSRMRLIVEGAVHSLLQQVVDAIRLAIYPDDLRRLPSGF